MKREVQLAIIGAGPGGYVAAIRAAQRGAMVCLIERDRVGGVCLNRGCIPTKTLAATAELYTRMRRAADYGLAAEGAGFDMERITRRKDEVVKRLASGAEYLLKKNGVELLKGTARLLSPHELLVTGEEGETVVAADYIVIAAGTVPFVPPAFGHDGRRVITSDEALNLTELPARIVIVGGGAIGCEFASIYRAFGSDVAVVEMLPGLLPPLDAELGRALALSFKKRGIGVHTGRKVEEVEKNVSSVTVRLDNGGILQGDLLLVAVGRKTVADELDLPRAGLAADARGRIPVDRDLRTAVPHIYAVGDINDKPYDLAHAASHQGLAVAESLFGPGRVYEDGAVPSCVFTDPEIASVGLAGEEAEAKGLAVRVGKFPYLANGRAVAMGEPEGWVKVVAEEGTGRILGVHIFGAHASDLVAEATLAVRHGLTVAELAETIHAHPTLAETIPEAAEGVFGLSIHV
ncbi:MAG: dihydrolipoyl dehydrogenase [Bacillota bacterium]